MPKLSAKSKLRRQVAREVAEQMAAEGDCSILEAAEKFAGEVSQVSPDGMLEVFLCAALYEMKSNGDADEILPIERALTRYDREETR